MARRLSQRQARRIRQRQRETEAAGGSRSGRVVAHYGRSVVLEDESGQLRRCLLRPNLPPLACGDRVRWAEAPGGGVVTALLPRRSLLARPDRRGRLRPVAANLDWILVVTAADAPPDPGLLDRYLVAARAQGIRAALVVNKIDRLPSRQRRDLEARFAVYRAIGYPVIYTSASTGEGIDALRELIADGTGILVGQSGVGKSSLIKALLPDLDIRIAAVDATGHGRHTTTTSRLYHLPGGGELVDSPGVRDFALWHLDPRDLERGFVEFAPYVGQCRFSNCRHDREPGCAVAAAAERGEISPRRLASYRRLLHRIQGQGSEVVGGSRAEPARQEGSDEPDAGC